MKKLLKLFCCCFFKEEQLTYDPFEADEDYRIWAANTSHDNILEHVPSIPRSFRERAQFSNLTETD
jgi:hypothetical protein